MRDMVSCLSENSINVTNPSCSSSNNNCISPTIAPSTQNAVTSIYKVSLPNTHFFVKVSWFKNSTIQSLAITLSQKNDTDDTTPAASFSFKLNLNSRLFRKKKGNKVFEPEKVELFWDFSNAKFEANPEPTEGFYVVVAFDSEVGLVLGDMADEQTTMKKLRVNKSPSSSRTTLVSRHEHCSGHATVYSTRARFCDSGTSHDILIRCGGENDSVVSGSYPALWVCIDKKTVIKVKRLQWNFRGNQTIFVDGLLVDLLWDVHDWFFKSQGSFGNLAVFMFRTRSGMDSRLWLEEKLLNSSQKNSKDHDRPEFSLLIYACKTSL